MDYTVTVNPSHSYLSHIAKFMGPTWDPPGSCRPQVGNCWPLERCDQGIYYFCNNKPVTTRQLTGPKSSWETAPYGIYVVQCVHWLYNATTFHDYVCGSRCVMFLSVNHCVLFRSDYHWQKRCPCKRSRSGFKDQGHRGANKFCPSLGISGS